MDLRRGLAVAGLGGALLGALGLFVGGCTRESGRPCDAASKAACDEGAPAATPSAAATPASGPVRPCTGRQGMGGPMMGGPMGGGPMRGGPMGGQGMGGPNGPSVPCGAMGGGPGGPGGPPGAACAFGSGALSPAALDAAKRALADERRAEAQYANVLSQLGEVRPFVRIRDAESRHSARIEELLGAHGADIPASAAPEPRKFANLTEACSFGVESEKANIAMYDELLAGDLPADERCVFEHLRWASREHHLPVFESCSP